MNDIVVFIPYDMESELMKKSADLLRIQQIDNNTQNIIIVGCPPKKEESDKEEDSKESIHIISCI
mgnify:CR=1 FL=1